LLSTYSVFFNFFKQQLKFQIYVPPTQPTATTVSIGWIFNQTFKNLNKFIKSSYFLIKTKFLKIQSKISDNSSYENNGELNLSRILAKNFNF